jgi:hypothetical protein
MKRTLIAVLLLAFACSSVIAQGKIKIKCPTQAELKAGIEACPLMGCGPEVDPHLNRQKNIRTGDKTPVIRTIEDLQALPDPVDDFAIGDTREKLKDLGEGDMITVVAFALRARDGVKESCNCGLSTAKDKDNHIVLVSKPTLELTAKATRAKPPAPGKKKGIPARTARENTLERRERKSVTAEFTPRVRLDHPQLAGRRLQALIDAAPKNALLVRVTGLQFFDSQHSIGGHLKRVKNWEIHPVMKLEFCPTVMTCTENSDDNWEDLEAGPSVIRLVERFKFQD